MSRCSAMVYASKYHGGVKVEAGGGIFMLLRDAPSIFRQQAGKLQVNARRERSDARSGREM